MKIARENKNASNGALYKENVAHNRRGKPEAFTARENVAMRHVLRGQMKLHKWTQAAAAQILGVSQQTIGQLVRAEGSARPPGGFSRPTALELAKLCGFDSPESMLRDMGALAESKDAPSDWPWRDLAVTVARRHGYDEKAIERVVARYTESQYRQRPMKWWMTKLGLEDAELEEERRTSAAAPPPASTPALPEPKQRRRKAAG